MLTYGYNFILALIESLIVGAHDANPNDFVRIQILNFCN
jgi:hypothetical protein